MATGTVILFPGGIGADGTGSGNNSAALSYRVSTGTQTANTPKAAFVELLLDPTTDEHWLYSFMMPFNYASGGTLRGTIKSAATSGNVIMKAGQVSIIVSSTATNAAVYAAADLSSAIAIAGTAGQEVQFTITLTMTNAAAGRHILIFGGRDADNASDTVNANDVELTTLNFEYTTT